jgi:hypothetical protein
MQNRYQVINRNELPDPLFLFDHLGDRKEGGMIDVSRGDVFGPHAVKTG